MYRNLALSFFLFIGILNAQNPLDSLNFKLNKATTDSAKIEVYSSIIYKKNIRQKLKDSIIDILTNHFRKDCFNGPYILFKLAQYHEINNSADDAVKLYIESLKDGEKCKSYAAMSRATNRLGRLNNKEKNYESAIRYLHESIFYCKKCSNVYDLAEDYATLGTIYKKTEDLDSSLLYHEKSLDIRLKLKDKKLISLTYNNIGLTYKKMEQYQTALDYINKAYDLVLEINDNKGTASLNNNKANIYRELGKYEEAIRYARMAVDTAFKFQTSQNMLNSLNTLAEAYDAAGDFKQSTEIYKLHAHVFDSIKLGEANLAYQDLQVKYDSDKKDAEIASKETILKLSESENSKKTVILIFSFIALFLTIVSIGFIYRSYKQSKRNAVELAEKNKVISEKNKEITDSINYAKNIQQSLLTSESVFAENSKDYFIFYQPKDIVSGDFYWAHKHETGFMVVCADCTGHGVPGAFMSLLGINYLNEIVTGKKILTPDLILNELRNKIIAGFNISNNKDGMDLSLISIENNVLRVAAANNPVWIIRNKQNLIIKPDKFPIGKHYGELKEFSSSLFTLQPNDLIIQFTDGLADQFGGPEGKKFKYKNIEKLIIENSDRPLNEIHSELKNTLNSWKGNMEQIDDILLIGLRV